MRIVLASESQFRRRAMELIGVKYETHPSAIDEKVIRDDDPGDLTRKLAEAKAKKVASECPGALIVAGDAVVSKKGSIFEKPLDRDQAVRFLNELSGSTFQFVTCYVASRAEF